MLLDFIGTNIVVVRRSDNGVQLNLLARDDGKGSSIYLNSDEWRDICKMAIALHAVESSPLQ